MPEGASCYLLLLLWCSGAFATVHMHAPNAGLWGLAMEGTQLAPAVLAEPGGVLWHAADPQNVSIAAENPVSTESPVTLKILQEGEGEGPYFKQVLRWNQLGGTLQQRLQASRLQLLS